MGAASHTEFAVINLFAHLFVLAAGKTKVIVVAFSGCVKLIANIIYFIV
jgi:hypothetical protein